MAARAAALFATARSSTSASPTTQCSNHVVGRDVVLHAENGVVGYGPFPARAKRTSISTTPAGSS